MLPRYHLKYCPSWSSIQGSRTSPQRRAFLWRRFWVVGSRIGSCLGFFFFVVGSPARTLRRSLFKHSQRGTWVLCPCPMGSLTARVLMDGGSAPLRVSTPSSSFVSRHLGPRVLSRTGSPQQDPAPWLRLAPSATPRRFPIQTRGMFISLTRLLLVLNKTTLRRNHSLSLRLVTPSAAN